MGWPSIFTRAVPVHSWRLCGDISSGKHHCFLIPRAIPDPAQSLFIHSTDSVLSTVQQALHTDNERALTLLWRTLRGQTKGMHPRQREQSLTRTRSQKELGASEEQRGPHRMEQGEVERQTSEVGLLRLLLHPDPAVPLGTWQRPRSLSSRQEAPPAFLGRLYGIYEEWITSYERNGLQQANGRPGELGGKHLQKFGKARGGVRSQAQDK